MCNRILNYFRDKRIKRQLTIYRQLLLYSLTVEKDQNYINAYLRHIKTLDEIELTYNKKDKKLLTQIIESESRSYGWSYLPNKYGEKVESAFWNLKKLIIV
jgi:hypothetical protein